MARSGDKRKLNRGATPSAGGGRSLFVPGKVTSISPKPKGGQMSVGGKDLNRLGTPPLADENEGRKASNWTVEEEEILESCVRFGMKDWRELSECIPGKSPEECRAHWVNRRSAAAAPAEAPDKPAASTAPKKSAAPPAVGKMWLEREDKILIENQQAHGNKWKQIQALLPGRSENAVKNRWKGPYIQKKIAEMRDRGELPPEEKKSDTSSSTSKGPTSKKAAAKKGGASSAPPVAGKSQPLPSKGEAPAKQSDAEQPPQKKKQKLATDDGKKQAKQRNRPSRSKAAMAERERQKAVEKERDEEAVKSLFGEGSPTLTEKEKDLIRRSYALGFTKGIKGNRKKGNTKAAGKPPPAKQQQQQHQQPAPAKQQQPAALKAASTSPMAQNKSGLWSDVLQWEFNDPQEQSPPPLLELEHTLGQHGIDLDFAEMPAAFDDSDEAFMQYNLGMHHSFSMAF